MSTVSFSMSCMALLLSFVATDEADDDEDEMIRVKALT